MFYGVSLPGCFGFVGLFILFDSFAVILFLRFDCVSYCFRCFCWLCCWFLLLIVCFSLLWLLRHWVCLLFSLNYTDLVVGLLCFAVCFVVCLWIWFCFRFLGVSWYCWFSWVYAWVCCFCVCICCYWLVACCFC